jgi:glycosyltransferase involved in cell wall biosynthesis
MRIISNLNLSDRSNQKFEYLFEEGLFVFRGLKDYVSTSKRIKEMNAKAILIFNPVIRVILFAFIYKSLFRGRAILTIFDLNLKKPRTFIQCRIASIKGWLINKADKVVCMHKDYRDYIQYYNIKPEKFNYVPFKANNYEIKDQYSTSDGNYVLTCGVSHRDYDAFFSAVDGLDIPIKLVLPSDDAIVMHMTKIHNQPPKNVEVIRHDFNKESWNQILSKASFVVIPIEEDCIQPAGISVYLEAMMLKKPVVITDCPATRGIINENLAYIVPQNNPKALKDGIVKLWNDAEARQALSVNGYQYANSLQGISRLIRDLSEVATST